MIDFITKHFGDGGPIIRFIGSVLMVLAISVETLIGVIIGTQICMGLQKILPSHDVPDPLAFIIISVSLIGPLLFDILGIKGIKDLLAGRWNELSAKKEQKKYDVVTPKVERGLGLMPHIGKKLTRKQKFNVVKNEVFHPYISEGHSPSGFIKVSESDKWVKIVGGLYPLDLICGYNETKHEIYFIDGVTVKLPFIARTSKVSSELNRFFEERGFYYEASPRQAGAKFGGVLNRPRSEIGIADWAGVRYKWETEMAKDQYRYTGQKEFSAKFGAFTEDGGVNPEFFERVLSTEEVTRVIKDLKADRVQLSGLLRFEEFKNEFSVCNAIRVLERLRYPQNAEGIDFLMECLQDVDEAFFLPAVEALKEIPKKQLYAKIEEKAEEAHKNGDALRLAGLLYLAHDIRYEIEYVKKVKEGLVDDETVSSATVIEENGLLRFAPDSTAEGAVQEAVAFEALK